MVGALVHQARRRPSSPSRSSARGWLQQPLSWRQAATSIHGHVRHCCVRRRRRHGRYRIDPPPQSSCRRRRTRPASAAWAWRWAGGQRCPSASCEALLSGVSQPPAAGSAKGDLASRVKLTLPPITPCRRRCRSRRAAKLGRPRGRRRASGNVARRWCAHGLSPPVTLLAVRCETGATSVDQSALPRRAGRWTTFGCLGCASTPARATTRKCLCSTPPSARARWSACTCNPS